ncbi:MAG: RNA ligase RtcB family protein [Paracoccaceae bacterium]
MGTPVMDGRSSASQSGAAINRFYTSRAWIDGHAETQLHHVSCWAGVSEIAAFPDLHVGKHGPVGCAVLADRIYPQLIGNDIGCGMSLFQLDLPRRKLKLERAVRRIRVLSAPLPYPQHDRLSEVGLPNDLSPDALGTIGGGNHFCEVQALGDVDPSEDSGLDPTLTYLLVHSGSRGLGASIFAALPGSALDGLLGEDAEAYRNQHDQAARWASLNRQIIAERTAEALRAEARLIVDAPHNLLTRTPQGWLHRKGAAVAGPCVPVAGSRATESYLVRAQDNPAALASLSHGAGRRYDRSSMHGRVRGKMSDLAAMTHTPFGGRVICEDRDLLIEEAPHAYKSADHVVQDLEDTGVATRIATLTPLLTFKKTREEART